MARGWILGFSALGVLAIATAASAERVVPLPSWSVLEAEQVAGRQIFKDHCASCHTAQPHQRAALAPSLNGVVGRRAGTLPGFPYSDALKSSGVVWSEENLRRWVADSDHTIANTLMPHVSIADPAEQIYLIAYLKTLKAPRAAR